MRKINLSFEELVKENMKELMEDPIAIKKIENRIDERQSKRFAKSLTKDKELTASNA
ncbi:MAG TPA: FbpB family small basic protein [Bacilli bacterium]|nr:FbpB family small basic protein [Bacilli bacterium]